MIPDINDVMDVARHMLFICLILSMPPLLTALVVGVLVSLVQTVTSIQEMTLTFVPKLVCVIGVVTLAMPWLIDYVCEYYTEIMQLFSTYYYF